MKTLVWRSSALFLILVIATILFYFGKGHRITFENRSITINQKVIKPSYNAKIIIGKDELMVMKGFENKIILKGPNHNIEIQFLDDSNKIVNTVKKNLLFCLEDGIKININNFMK